MSESRKIKKLAQLEDIDKSRLVQHSLNEDHRILWSKASIISKKEKLKRRELKEAAFLSITENPSVNSLIGPNNKKDQMKFLTTEYIKFRSICNELYEIPYTKKFVIQTFVIGKFHCIK